MKLIAVFCALVMACSGAFAQQKIAWEAQHVVFVSDMEGKISLNNEKQFRFENEKQFLTADIITEETVRENPTEYVYKMATAQEGYNLISKGDMIKTEQGARGHYMVAEYEKQQVAFAVISMEGIKYPLLISFSINSEEDVKKILHNIFKM
jgi:hypothetical protein